VTVNKRQIWINGGIHAREWISSHVAMFLIKQLITGYGKDAVSTRLLDNYEFVFAPHINPDGYEYSRKVNRMVRYTEIVIYH
jgi:murein tripeptide amidase MpaA